MWLWREQIDWTFTQKYRSESSLLKRPNVCFEIRAFLTYLGQFSSNLSTCFSIQKSLPSPQSKSFEKNKEMTFDCSLANVTNLVVRGFYCPSPKILIQKAVHEFKVNSQSKLNLFSPIVPSSAILQTNRRWHATNISWHTSCYFWCSVWNFQLVPQAAVWL